MIFRINNIYNEQNLEFFKILKWDEARKQILLFPMHQNEINLDYYLQINYKMSLKQACLKILYDLNFEFEEYKNIIVVFKNKELEKLAMLITYGNLEIKGSKILQCALS